MTFTSNRRRILTGAQALLIVLGIATSSDTSSDAWAQAQRLWSVPEIGALPRDANGLLVRAGRDLITATYAHIGRTFKTHRSAMPATTSPAPIVTCRQAS